MLNHMLLTLLASVAVFSVFAASAGWADAEGTPVLRREHGAVQLFVDGKPFIMLAGELHNSSASSLEYMEPVWERLKALHCNTVLATASWELVEPEEGKFDFALIDGLIDRARKHDLKLVFLWFGTWKNTFSSYTPSWVKTDLKRFPRVIRPDNGEPTGAISAWSEAACAADARAFGAFMRHLKKVDGTRHTVVMIQVENETGLLGHSRDYYSLAKSAFEGPVPNALMDYLKQHRDSLLPEIVETWKAAGNRESGTWQEVFGPGASGGQPFGPIVGADEPFMAWHVARYVERVASAGKKEYDLPMFANAWLVQHDGELPGQYPSGGPVSRMMDVWRAAAPSIDLIAPDIYLPDFKAVNESYTRSGNPLLIPEAQRGDVAAANVFWALAQHDAICFAPFGIDSVPAFSPIGKSYAVLSDLLPIIAAHQGTGTMAGVLRQGDEREAGIDLGGYRLKIVFSDREGKVPAAGLVVATAPGEFLVAGYGFSVRFEPGSGAARHVEFLLHEEGRFADGQWIPGRRLNGDEYNVVLGEETSIRKCRLFAF